VELDATNAAELIPDDPNNANDRGEVTVTLVQVDSGITTVTSGNVDSGSTELGSPPIGDVAIGGLSLLGLFGSVLLLRRRD